MIFRPSASVSLALLLFLLTATAEASPLRIHDAYVSPPWKSTKCA